LPDWQRTEQHPARADALQASDFESYHLAHTTNLALSPFPQAEAQLILVLPNDLGGLEFDAIERQAVP
jgi:hypothetical protein